MYLGLENNMKIVIQRVLSASVSIDNQVYSKINNGLLILFGVAQGDSYDDIVAIMDKAINLRIFSDEEGKMNNSAIDVGAEILLVSQFTLLANCKKGRRPSFIEAAKPEIGKELYEKAIDYVKHTYKLTVKSGQFGADMKVELINDGPVTIILDSEDLK